MCTKFKFLTLSVILFLTSFGLHASDGPGKKPKKQSSGLVQDKWYNGFKIYMLKNFYTIKARDREGHGIFYYNYLSDSTYIKYQYSYHTKYIFKLTSSATFGLEKQWKINDKFNIYTGMAVNGIQFDYSTDFDVIDSLPISKNYFKQGTYIDGFDKVIESYNTPKPIIFDDGNRDGLVVLGPTHFTVVSFSIRSGVRYNLSNRFSLETGLAFSTPVKIQQYNDAYFKDLPSSMVPYITYAPRLINLYHLQSDFSTIYRLHRNFELGLHYQLTLNNYTNPGVQYIHGYSFINKTRASYWGISLGLRI